MVNQVLLYLGSAFPLFWGIAHLFPTGLWLKDSETYLPIIEELSLWNG